jgi:hypothetical protein
MREPVLAVPVQMPLTAQDAALTRFTVPVLPSQRQDSAVPLDDPGTGRMTCEIARSSST